jgi:hypothetical protein
MHLIIDNQELYEKDSQKMAELACDYHENTQKDETIIEKALRNQCIKNALAAIKTAVSTEQSTLLDKVITEDEVVEVLQKFQNLKSPNMDGFTYELWKYLHQLYKSNKGTENEPEIFNIAKLLTECFNDIQLHGIVESTDFSLGWMCPIYKKNNRNEIANYHPITILNLTIKFSQKCLFCT